MNTETIDRNELVRMAEDAIRNCSNMDESAYKEYGPIAAMWAQACATLALVKLLEESVYADEIKALR